MAVEVVLDAVEVVVLHEVAHERAHVRAYLLVREVDGAPVAERRTLPLLGTPHQAVGIVLLEVGEERIRLLERTGGVVRVVHADRHEDLQPVRAAERGGYLKRVGAHREKVGRDVPLPAMRLHAVGFAGLAAGEASEPGAERTVRDGGDARAERMDEPTSREVPDRHRQVRRPVVRVVAVRVVHERARPRQRLGAPRGPDVVRRGIAEAERPRQNGKSGGNCDQIDISRKVHGADYTIAARTECLKKPLNLF